MNEGSSIEGSRMTEPGSRVLVTGVTGLVGTRVAASLLMNRCEVVALSRNPSRAQEKVAAISRAWQWTDEGPIPPVALQGVDAVVHLAGESVAGGRWSDERKRAIERSRVDGTHRLVDAIAAQPEGQRPHVLVSASAIGYYGDTGERAAIESDPPGDDFLAKVCASWEREAMRAEELGVRVVRLRIGLVLAREGGALEKMLPLFRMGLGGKIGSGKQFWPWVHLDDVVGLVQFAIETSDLRGALNATSPGLVRQSEFAAALARVLYRPAFLPAPAFAIKTVLGEFATEVLSSHRVIPARTREVGYPFRFPELEPALRELLG